MGVVEAGTAGDIPSAAGTSWFVSLLCQAKPHYSSYYLNCWSVLGRLYQMFNTLIAPE